MIAVVSVVVGGIAGLAAQPAAAAVPPQVSGTPFFGWGNNSDGQIGDGTTDNDFSPEAVTLPGGVDPAEVAEGSDFSLALGSDSLIYSWGDNSEGQLGDGTNSSRQSPQAIALPGGTTAVDVSAGLQFSLAVGSDGLVYWWGTDPAAGLGDPETGQQDVPVQMALPGGDKARSVAAFGDAATAIGVDGKLFVWGDNFGGELGDGTTTDQTAPEEIALPGSDPVASVAIGAGFGLATGTDGKLFSWGDDNGSGELGDGGTDQQPTPAEISLPGGVAARSVAAGENYSLASGADGRVYSWGADQFGTLGDGGSDTEVQLAPAAIALPFGALAASVASTGYLTSFAVGQDGALYAWGYNFNGEIGDGTLNESSTPKAVQMPGGAAVAAVSAQNVVLAISPPSGSSTPRAPQFVQASPPRWTAAGEQFAYTVVASGTPAPTYALASGAPAWLAADPTTGKLTGSVPSGITSFSFAVTATNSQGTATTPLLTVGVGPRVPIGGHVIDVKADAVAGALVQLCASNGCTQTTTDSSGAYQLTAIVGDSMTLTGFPPAASTTAQGERTFGPLTVPQGGSASEDIGLPGYAALPSDTSIPSLNNATPTTLFWTEPVPITVTGCPNGVGTTTITGPDSTTGQLSVRAVVLTETPPGSGTYTGTIPPMYPIDGPSQVTTSVDCPSAGEVAPAIGPAAGGGSVFLSGSGFTGASAVTFGGAPATGFSVVSDGTIEATPPAGNGTVDVAVSVAGGEPATVGQYSYQGIASISPGTGPQAGGTSVTIAGAGLAQATQVLFGSTPVDFTQVSDTQITTVSPPGTGIADIQVVTPYGTTPVAAADQFAYSTAGGAASTAASSSAATAAKSPVTAPSHPRLTAAVSANLVKAVTDAVSYTVPGLITEKDTTKILVAGQNALRDYSCENSKAYDESLISLAVSPIADQIAEEILSPVLVAGAAAAGVALPLALVLVPLAIILVDVAVDLVVDKIIEAEADAILGNCSGVSPVVPNILIDPSGTVVDSHGAPISGATVTLLRSDTADGTFTPMDPTNPGIEPPVNPQTTSADGDFHWDVSAGYYKVQATAPGCTDPADPRQAAATIGPYPVPPPRVGLVITMACASEPPPVAPAVQGLSQSSGAAAGGDTVTVTGTGFTPDATVDFGSVPSPSVTYLSGQDLSVVTPPGFGGVDVTVRTDSATSATGAADKFFFGSAPTVTGLSTAHGPAAGGGSITITGTGFTGATAVWFGPVPATGTTVVSDTQITATIPQNLPGTVNVTVANPAGTSATDSADQYTYAGAPPGFTAASPPLTATAGTNYTYAFAASGTPAPVFALAPGSPAWLTISAATGLVQGVPPTGAPAFTYAVTATNNSAAVTVGPFAVAVAPAPSPRIDAQASATGPSTATVTTTANAPGDLLAAFVAADGPAKADQKAAVTGGGLKWTLAARDNTQYGDAEIWTAQATKQGKYKVTSALTRTGYSQQLTVLAFAGAARPGSTATADARTGAPTASLTTSGADSWVFAVGADWDRSVKRTVAAGQTILAQATEQPGDTYWVQAPLTPTPTAATTVKINDTAPVNDRWNLALIEILAAGH